jgi:hypothetical protein
MSMLESRTLTAQDRRRFQNTLCKAVLAGGYEQYITQQQADYPELQWTPLITGHPFPLHRSALTTTANLSTAHIYALFFINRIPASWVKTMYAPCLYLLRSRPIPGIDLDTLEQARIHYINRLGHFPVGEERFNHWVAPTSDDQIRLSNLMMGDQNSPTAWSQFVQFGADVDHRTLLTGRPAPTFDFENQHGSSVPISHLEVEVSLLTMNPTSQASMSLEPPAGSMEAMSVDDIPTQPTTPADIPLPPSPRMTTSRGV